MKTFSTLTKAAAATAALGLAVTACSSSSASSGSGSSSSGSKGCPRAAQNSNVAAPPGYKVCLFAAATTNANHPDEVRVVGDKVWVGWQNGAAKDGTNGKSSTIAEYTSSGKLLKTWSLSGHADGMRFDTATGVMWVTTDEDGNPKLFTINPSSSAPTQYAAPKTTPWGGGFDDITFVNGSAFISASNPSLDSAGKNNAPALVKATLTGGKVVLTPALAGQPKATSLNPPVASTKLNVTDPDSQTVDPQGDLVLMSQADGDLLFIHNPGASSQKVSYLSIGTQVDDTIWPTSSHGCLLVADNASGVFSICSDIWVPATPVSGSPNDAGVISFVGTLNMGSGQLTPLITGIGNPHGMAFLPK